MPTKPPTHPSDLCIKFNPDNYDLGDDADDIERVHSVIDRANERIEALAAEVMAFRGTFGWAMWMAMHNGCAVRHSVWSPDHFIVFDAVGRYFDWGDGEDVTSNQFLLMSGHLTGWTLSDGTLGPEVGT